MSDPLPVAEVLRRLRSERGKTVREVARDVGITPSYLSRVERGEKTLSPDVRSRLTSYYEVDAIALAAGTVPEDIIAILRSHPDLLTFLRNEYGDVASS